MSSIPNVNPSYSSDRPQVIGRIGGHKPEQNAPAPAQTQRGDSVEFSSAALSASSTADTARAERIARIKAQIQAGTYGEDAKLTFAADRIAKLLAEG
ncbi:MAG: flagellar biosynthesis anti-sigma factor FlgM [Phycisphaerales bacterium]|nr:flagellar biosynthesis anti-sigma factor FlgM [Phycisphaerales bacterium]